MKPPKDAKRTPNKRRRKKDQQEVTWNDVETRTIADLIRLAEALDGAVRLGRSRDRCVFSIGFYVGDESFTEWVRNDDERDDTFARIIDEIAEDFDVADSIFGPGLPDS